VRFWFVDHVMDPSLTLLNAKISPFRFRHQMGFRDQLGDVLGQHDMPCKEVVSTEFTWSSDVEKKANGPTVPYGSAHTESPEPRTRLEKEHEPGKFPFYVLQGRKPDTP